MTKARFLTFLSLLCLCGLLVAGGWLISKSKTWQWTGDLFTRLETTEKIVALTFDDGPSPNETRDVLKILDDHGIKATFYLNGAPMQMHMEATKSIVAAGHELGNHGYTHRRMALRTSADLARELDRTDALIRAAGYTGEITFRPPFGQKLVNLPRLLKERNMLNVMWSVDPMGAVGWYGPAADFVSYTLDTVQPGDIILLHPMFRHNVEVRLALPGLITGLQDKGYRFVTVAEMVAAKGR